MIHERLATCFRNALGLPADAPVEHLSYLATKEWDSLAHMRLVAAVETEFDIMFTTEHILDMSSYAKARDILALHGLHA